MRKLQYLEIVFCVNANFRIPQCVFHAILMAYFEQVRPKLPHKRTKKKELTDDGEIYGKSYIVIPISLYPNVVSHIILL